MNTIMVIFNCYFQRKNAMFLIPQSFEFQDVVVVVEKVLRTGIMVAVVPVVGPGTMEGESSQVAGGIGRVWWPHQAAAEVQSLRPWGSPGL